MYINKHFALENNEDAYSLIQAYPFATLVANNDNQIHATHVPLVLHRHEGEKGTLWGHVPLRDPISGCISSAATVLAVFCGCRSYVSPNWYGAPGLPTYNFTAVHARGRFTPVASEKKLHTHLSELTDLHEANMQRPWRIEYEAPSYVQPLLKHILAFSIEIESIEGKCKLSQNRSQADRQSVIQGLRQCKNAESKIVADLMETYPYRQNHAMPLFELS